MAVHFRRSVSGITQTWHFGIARERTLARRDDIRSVADAHEGGHVLRQSTASGINNAISRIASMLAVALLGAFAVGTFRSTLDARLTELQVTSDIRHALKAEVPKLAEAQVPSQVQGEQRLVLKQALEESFVRSFRLAMLVSACVALASALCAWLTTAPLAGWKTRTR